MVVEMLENKNAIVEKLVENGMNLEEISARIKEKQEEYGGLLTDAGAAYAIAKEKGIDLGFEPKHEMVQINQIRPGLEDVSIEGEVTQVFPVKSWQKDDRSGKVASIIVRDDSGEVRLTLWNNNCDLIENGDIQRGAKVRVENASAKERNGLTELNLGYRGEIKVLEKGRPELTKLSDIEEGMNDVSFVARVDRIYPLTEFEKNGEKGRVLSMIVSDGTERRLALWDDNTKWNGKIKEGDTILVEGAYVRMNRGKPELNLGWRGRLVPNPQGIEILRTAKRSEIAKLKEDGQAEIRATVVKIYPPTLYEVCAKCGKKYNGECCGEPTKAMVINTELDDGTGVVKAVFFREQSEKLAGVTAEEYSKNPESFDEMRALGQELVVVGMVRHNAMFDRSEFIVKNFHEANAEEEIKMLEGD